MERLTKRDVSENAYYPHCFDSVCGGEGCKDADNCTFFDQVCDRLAAYEDTRLDPEQIPTGFELANVFAALQMLKRYEAIGTVEQLGELAPVVYGEWKQSVLANDFFRCSICSAVWSRKFNYCPNCGAKMDLEVPQDG